MNDTARASVLIVDDDATVRHVLQRWLELAGYSTQQAEHPRAALAMMAMSRHAVVICDVDVPDPDDRWFVAQLREKYPTVAVILCTHINDVRQVEGSASRYLVKPFRQVQVVAATAEAVAWHQAADSRDAAAGTCRVEGCLEAQ